MSEVKKALLRMSNKDVALRLLAHSFKDVQFLYEFLTRDERALCSQEEFDSLVEEMKEMKLC